MIVGCIGLGSQNDEFDWILENGLMSVSDAKIRELSGEFGLTDSTGRSEVVRRIYRSQRRDGHVVGFMRRRVTKRDAFCRLQPNSIQPAPALRKRSRA